MAKIHNYYVLCPLIDQKSFLGISPDKDKECVTVTLGRNVVNQYRLSDQNQVRGWTSRDHITSAVVYDNEQDSYVGVFNNNTVKIWKEDADNLDKVKKYKFPINILKLIPRPNQSSLIIFSNGNCASLPYAIDNRKTYEGKSIIKENEDIIDTASYNIDKTNFICYIVKNNKDQFEIISCPIREELGDLEKSKLSKVKMMRPDDVYVVGQLINVTDHPRVYILWSDSKLTMYDLNKKAWKTIGSVPWISTFKSISVGWMGKNHLILFGSNIDQDGAILVAYNIMLGIGSCKYPMKMYTENAKIYCYASRIMFEASNHIAMLPYLLETNRNLSSILGSHEITDDEKTEIVNWDSSKQKSELYKASDEIKEYLQLGITERTVCARIILPLIEKSNTKQILNIISEFKDIPESVLVKLFNYVMKIVNAETFDLKKQAAFNKFCRKYETNDHFELLRQMFCVTFSDALLIPFLRNGLTLNDTLFLMSYIRYLLVDCQLHMETDYESKLLDWCTLFMDSFYQQFLMTKDDKVTFVLQNILEVVSSFVKKLTVIDSTLNILNKFLYTKCKDENNDQFLPYSIELIQI